MEFTTGSGTVESLWVRIKGQTNNSDIIMGVLLSRSNCRPPIQGGNTNVLLFEELMDTCRSTSVNLHEINGKLVQPGPEDSLKTWMTALWNKSLGN